MFGGKDVNIHEVVVGVLWYVLLHCDKLIKKVVQSGKILMTEKTCYFMKATYKIRV